MLALGFVEQQCRRYRLQDRLRGPAAAALLEPNVAVGDVSEWIGRPPAARVVFTPSSWRHWIRRRCGQVRQSLRSVTPIKENRVMGEYRHVAEDEWGAGTRDGRRGDPGRAPDRLQQAITGADR
jgi:hypothetical protein